LTATRFSATAAAALALLVPVVAGALAPAYSHTAQYISELGAIGMPLGVFVSFVGFLPTGLLVGACLVIAARRTEAAGSARIGYLLLMSVALAYLGAAFARCYVGGAAEGSVRQATPRSGRRVLALAGVVTLLAFAAMASPPLAPWRGLAQRVAETALFGSLLLIGWRLPMVDSRAERAVGVGG